MCNTFEQQIAYKAYVAAIEKAGLAPALGQSERDLPPKKYVRVQDAAPVVRVAGNGVELASMRWSFPAGRAGGKPVFNFRSEGRRFAESKRCLVPASAFYEFTGATSPKTRHRFTLAGAPFLCIAGLWRPGAEDEPERFTLLTTEPGPDVIPYHDRQIVILRPEDWSAWLYLTKPESELLRPLPAHSLHVETEPRIPAAEPRLF